MRRKLKNDAVISGSSNPLSCVVKGIVSAMVKTLNFFLACTGLPIGSL